MKLSLALAWMVLAGSVAFTAMPAWGDGAAASRQAGETGSAARKQPRSPQANLIETAGRIQSSARRRWPGSFAGLWVERGHIFVAFTERAAARLKKIDRQIGGPQKKGKPKPVTFNESLIELEALLDRGAADRGTGARPISAPYDLSIDQQRNAMVVTVENAEPRVVENFQTRYGPSVIVEQGYVSEPYACTVASCFPTLRAGLISLIPKSTGVAACTTGFVVRHRGSAQNLILSSAHCGGDDAGNPGGIRQHGSPAKSYGWTWNEEYEGGVDAEVQRVSSAYDSKKPYIRVSDPVTAGPVYGYGALAHLVEGTQLCKSGQKTGYSCGPVTDLHFISNGTPSVPGEYMIRTDICAQPGDSGAPVFRNLKLRQPAGKIGYQAQGLLSGGPKKNGVAPPCSDPGFYSFFSHIELIHKALSVRVLRLRDLKK